MLRQSKPVWSMKIILLKFKFWNVAINCLSLYKDVAMFIPTRGCFKPALRRTVRNLCLEQLYRSNVRFKNLKLVVPQEEAKEWHNTAIEIVVVDNGWRIEDIRQHILDKYQQYQYHIVLDDDLKLRKRNGPGSVDITRYKLHTRFSNTLAVICLYSNTSKSIQNTLELADSIEILRTILEYLGLELGMAKSGAFVNSSFLPYHFTSSLCICGSS